MSGTFDTAVVPYLNVGVGALSTGTKARAIVPHGFEVVAATLTAATVAPVSSAALIDVNIDAVSVFTTRLTYADGATAVTGNVLDATKVAGTTGQTLTVDVDQVGSGTAGTGGTVTVWCRKR